VRWCFLGKTLEDWKQSFQKNYGIPDLEVVEIIPSPDWGQQGPEGSGGFYGGPGAQDSPLYVKPHVWHDPRTWDWEWEQDSDPSWDKIDENIRGYVEDLPEIDLPSFDWMPLLLIGGALLVLTTRSRRSILG
jgi:hypothetical protein